MGCCEFGLNDEVDAIDPEGETTYRQLSAISQTTLVDTQEGQSRGRVDSPDRSFFTFANPGPGLAFTLPILCLSAASSPLLAFSLLSTTAAAATLSLALALALSVSSSGLRFRF